MKSSHILTILIASAVFLMVTSAVDAAYLQFNPTTATVSQGGTFSTSIIVNAGSDEVSSTDAYVLYNSQQVELQSFTAGSFFPYVVHDPKPGKVVVRGIVEDAATSRTGSGTLATLTFKVLAPGTSTLSFFCDLNASDTSKIVKSDLNATNLIICTQNNTFTATILTPTPTVKAGTGTPAVSPTGGSGGNNNGSGSNNNNSGTGSGNNGSGGSQGGPGNGGNANIGGNVTPPSRLPRSGGFDNIRYFALAGSVLFIVGGLATLVL